VKLHTIFRGDVESGLCKILAVGLENTEALSRSTDRHPAIPGRDRAGDPGQGFRSWRAWRSWKNSLDETMEVHVVPRERFEATDAALFEAVLAGAPPRSVRSAGRLVVDEMGKNISGHRHGHQHHRDRRSRGGKMTMGTPVVSTIAVLGLTPETHGNAKRHRPRRPHDPAPGGLY